MVKEFHCLKLSQKVKALQTTKKSNKLSLQLILPYIVAEMLAQCEMIWMLLSMSVGWTLGSPTAHPIRDRRQLSTISAVALVHLLLVLWEQTYDESHYTYHVHESFPGLLLTLFRVGLVVLFGYNLRQTMATERSALRKDFYQSFAIVSRERAILCYVLNFVHEFTIITHTCRVACFGFYRFHC